MTETTQQVGKLNVFVSYSRDDLAFADQLYAALGAFDYELSIDRHSIVGGDEWEKRLGALIREAGTVVFLLSPSSAVSKFCKWEVEEALRLSKRILPVLCRPLDGVSPPPQLASRNYIYLYTDSELPGSGFGSGLAQLVRALNTDLDWLRQHTEYLRQANNWDEGGRSANRLLSGPDIAAAKAWVTGRPKNAPEPTALQVDFIKASEVEDERQNSAEAQRLREIAETQAAWQKALAESIINDLGLESGEYLTPRQRKALWKLAVADEPTKQHFVSILGSPEETVRTAPGFAQIWRALGLLRPSAAEAENLAAAVVGGIQTLRVNGRGDTSYLVDGLKTLTPKIAASRAIEPLVRQIAQTTDSAALNAFSEALEAMAAKLSEGQASQALEPLLRQISQTTDPDALRALLRGLEAMAAKLSEGQASQALEPLLRQIGQTTNFWDLQPLAQVLKALAGKLSKTEASRAIEPLLQRIGQTTDPYATAPNALQALAEAIQALAGKLSETEASQAIEPLLKRIGQTTNPGMLQVLAEAIQGLPTKMSKAQASEAIERLLEVIGRLLKQIGLTIDPRALQALAGALQALPGG
jgi:hypothetical protein